MTFSSSVLVLELLYYMHFGMTCTLYNVPYSGIDAVQCACAYGTSKIWQKILYGTCLFIATVLDFCSYVEGYFDSINNCNDFTVY